MLLTLLLYYAIVAGALRQTAKRTMQRYVLLCVAL